MSVTTSTEGSYSITVDALDSKISRDLTTILQGDFRKRVAIEGGVGGTNLAVLPLETVWHFHL